MNSPLTHDSTKGLPSVRMRGVSRSFIAGAIKTEVLRGVSLDIWAGKVTFIMGPSGSGKTTLLAILGGLLKPSDGKVEVLGFELTTLTEDALDHFRMVNLGFIFQGFNLFPALTALDQVKLILNYAGVIGADSDQRAWIALEEVQLTPFSHHRPHELSGGQKQRVAIARSLVKCPRLILADEPTSALDGASGQVVVELLQRAAHVRGATVVVVTHDARLLKYADRIVHLEDGHIVRDEQPSELVSSEQAHV